MHRLISLIPVVLDSEPVLACPLCGQVEVHPTSVRCNPAGELPGQVRIDLFFWCERGHTFAVSFHFHKGRTLVKRTLDPADPPSKPFTRGQTVVPNFRSGNPRDREPFGIRCRKPLGIGPS